MNENQEAMSEISAFDNVEAALIKLNFLPTDAAVSRPAVVGRPHRLVETISALLTGRGAFGPTTKRFVTRTRGDIIAALSHAGETDQIESWAKSGPNSAKQIVDGLIALRDAMHISLEDDAHRLGKIIHLADPRSGQMSRLLDRGLETGGFADLSGLGLNRNEVARLEVVQQLAKASGDRFDVVAGFMAQQAGEKQAGKAKRKAAPADSSAFDPEALIYAAVAAPLSTWEALLSPPPVKSPAKAGAKKAANAPDPAIREEAALISAKLKLAYPRAALRADFAATKSATFKPVADLMAKHLAFDPLKQSADSFFRNKRGVTTQQLETAKSFQRLMKIAPEGDGRVATASQLHEAGYASAGQILKTGKIDFTANMAAQHAMAPELAEAIYCRAREVGDLRAELQIQLAHAGVRDLVQWHDFKNELWAVGPNGNANLTVTPPSLAEMFGSFDACACRECQSVHSAASYLHNLLHWMKSDVAGAWGALEKRRPDIKHLLLNCANTHTLLPYIDLVNEQLCARIESASQPVETTWAEPALRLQPEYRYRRAEDDLATKRFFPLSLPFDRSAAESEAALRAVGISTNEAMDILIPAHDPSWSAAKIADLRKLQDRLLLISELGLTEWLYDFLTDVTPATPGFWANYTGVTAAPDENVGKVMKALGVGFDEMRALLDLDFVKKAINGGLLFGYDSIKFADDKCSYDNATFVATTGVNNKLDPDVCRKAICLMRLARATGYAEAQLDGWIKRFADLSGADVAISREFLDFLRHARRIESLTKVSINATFAFVEMLAATSPNTPANINAFVDLYGLRSSDDVTRLFKLYPGELQPGDSSIAALSARLEQLDTIFDAVVDTTKVAAWTIKPPTSSWGPDACAYINAKLKPKMSTSVKLDREVLEATIFEALEAFTGIGTTIAQQVYVANNDPWFDLFHVDKKASLPASSGKVTKFLKDLRPFAQALWLSETLDACGSSAALKTAASAMSAAKFHVNLNGHFALRVAKLRGLAKRFVIREELLASALFGPLDTDLNPSVKDAWDKIVAISPAMALQPIDHLAVLERALRLQKLYSKTGAGPALIDGIFLSPGLSGKLDSQGNVSIKIAWRDINLPQQADDNAAKLTKAIAETNAESTRIMDALRDGLDDVRKAFRDALVDYTLGKESGTFADVEEIYKLLLLDPEMQPCMMTSRLVLATSSVQLLMHRAMLNLEGEISPSQDNLEEFEWRKNFRVWEANVKVLLYPENWIIPDLRLDQTPQFKTAVAALSQDELNEENCETIVYDYLAGLDKVARLDIRAFYRDETTTPSTLHVFGRTWNAPYEYFHRQRTYDNIWTPWEKIDIDIEGDHLIPVMFHRRLWLFWPIFVEKEHRDIKVNVNGEMRGAPYLEIRMAYTKFEHGRWRGKKLLDPVVTAGTFSGPGVALNIRRKLGADKKQPQKQINSHEIPQAMWDLHNWNSDNIPDSPQIWHPFYYTISKHFETVSSPLLLSYDGEDGNSYSNYSMSSLDKNSFFFHASINSENKLQINIRREYHSDWETWHDGYTELAHEDGFLIDSCGESGRLMAAEIPQNDLRIVARPYRTLPNAQNMVEGFDRPDTARPDPLYPLYAKVTQTHASGSDPILVKAPLGYQLTYPQKKDAMWTEPFFMADNRRTHFFERKAVCKQMKINGPGQPPVAILAHSLTQDDRYTVALHEHPYTCQMISALNEGGLDGLFAVKSDNEKLRRQAKNLAYFKTEYDPGALDRINLPLPREEFDFATGGAYSDYNWELFFHLPTLIARQLKTDGRHREAIRWLRLVFDPTSREPLGTRRVWRAKPFMTASTETSIQALLKLLNDGPIDPAEEQMRDAVEAQIRMWRERPFEPHKIAEHRLSAYMLWSVLEYVDVLIEWGDALFRQDSMESINEATNLYLLASEILGTRPTVVDRGTSTKAKSFYELSGAVPTLTAPASVNVPDMADEIEAMVAGYNVANDCRANDDGGCKPAIGASLFPGQYFCVPPNPKLPEYWDRVEDRLFKIRHCRNLAGEQRSLALFQPPIDPALLVRARASGLSIEDVMANLAEAKLPYRFNYLLGKAQDFTAEVKALGGQLLSAIEKRDAEELGQIRQTHEINIQRATRSLKQMSLAEAKEGLAALQHSLKGAEITLSNYEGRQFMNPFEIASMGLTVGSDIMMQSEQGAELFASILHLLPDTHVGTMSFAKMPTGDKIAAVAQAIGKGFGIVGSQMRSAAGVAGTMGSYKRRQEDWQLQIETTRERIKELNRQIISAEIRIQTAEKDLEIFDQQIENSKEIYDHLRSKFTNAQLYEWMVGQLKSFHRRAYELAAGMARQAQMAYKRELGDGTTSPTDVLTADHWDSGRAGLLAGEKLSLQLKRLDDAYARERAKLTIFELSRTVSLRRLDPAKLFALKGGVKVVDVMLPEWLFQTKHDGQMLKDMRLKAVSISLPCTVGPNVRVPLKVRLTGSPIGPAQQSIITSTAQSDSGRFDPNPNGEMYLPFENEPVASTWEISLPEHLEFDPATITDLIFHIRYTAQPVNSASNSNLTQTGTGQFAVSLRHDNYDGWLDLQRNLASLSAGLDFAQVTNSLSTAPIYYDSDAVNSAKPYAFGQSSTNTLIDCYALHPDGTVSAMKPVSNSTPVKLKSITDAIKFDGKDVIDLVCIYSTEFPF